MAQAKTGQDVLILFPVFGKAAGRQKIQPVNGLRCGDFFCVAPAAEKILPGH